MDQFSTLIGGMRGWSLQLCKLTAGPLFVDVRASWTVLGTLVASFTSTSDDSQLCWTKLPSPDNNSLCFGRIQSGVYPPNKLQHVLTYLCQCPRWEHRHREAERRRRETSVSIHWRFRPDRYGMFLPPPRSLADRNDLFMSEGWGGGCCCVITGCMLDLPRWIFRKALVS